MESKKNSMAVVKSLFILVLLTFSYSCSKDDDGNNENIEIGSKEKAAYVKILSSSSNTLTAKGGSTLIRIESNTEWTVTHSGSINGLDVTPQSGTGSGSVKVSYKAVETSYYSQTGSVSVWYNSGDHQKREIVNFVRRRLN